MAGNSTAGGRVVTNTLSGSSLDIVYLAAPGNGVAVTNLTGTAPIYFTVGEPGGACPIPSVGASVGNVFCAASVAGATVNVRHDGMYGSIIQLISSGAPSYMVAVTGQLTNA